MRLCLRALLALALVWAAGAQRPRADDLVAWTPAAPGERVAFENIVAAYNAKKGAAGPHVKMVAMPFDGFADQISAMVPRGKGPDIFVYPQDRLGGWVLAGNTVVPIDALVDAATLSHFIPSTVQALTYRGALYGLPLTFKVITLIYNKKLVQAPPKTTAELEALAKKLTHRASGTYGLVYSYTDYYYHAALQNGFGGRVFDENMRPVLDSPENLRAMELLLQWKRDFLPAEDPSRASVANLFREGKAAMVFSGPWILADIAKSIDYGLAPLPALSEAKDQPMRPWMTVGGVYITATCRQKEAAADFLKWSTDVVAAKMLAAQRQTPANQKAYLDAALLADEVLTAFFMQVRVAIPMPNSPEMTVMWPSATLALTNVARKDVSPREALAKAQAQVVKNVGLLYKKPQPPPP
jgi:arabinogalactan oligomer/maltooligosaccharide transport system substrate-binding protein